MSNRNQATAGQKFEAQDGLGAGGKRRFQPTAAIAVIEQIPIALDDGERARISAIGRCLLASEPALNATAAFGHGVAAGQGPWPALVIEDHSAIALFEKSGDGAYSYRGLLLAGDGDMVLIGVPRIAAFEAYCQEHLGLGAVEVLSPRTGDPGKPLALRATEDDALIALLGQRARAAGGLNLVAYMGTGYVWKLAGRIAAAARRPVRVLAAPPRLTRRVNDKSWFAERLVEVLGPRAAPPSTAVYSFSGLAAQVSKFARRHDSVAVKLRDSASSTGNLVFDSAILRRSSLRRVYALLRARLAGLGWDEKFPLVVTAWEGPVLASPSAQLWIPAPEDGGPVVEGVFDQTIFGETAIFGGAAASTLSPAWQARVATEAVKLGTLLQALGYFGRCSFDSILIGRDCELAELHWVECNGRWGGVSIPMTLTNRLAGDWTRLPPVIIEDDRLHGRQRTLQDILCDLQDDLYRRDSHPNGLVILSPGRLEAGTGYEAMVLEATAAEGRTRAESLVNKLIAVIGAGAVHGLTKPAYRAPSSPDG